MPYYKFNSNDVYINTLKTYPSVKFLIYSGSSFYNNTPNISGAWSNPIRLTDGGNISLYELNVDRNYVASSTRLIGPAGPPDTTTPDKGLIYPWVVKNGTRIGFRTTSNASFNALGYGDVMLGSYPLTSSIDKELYFANTKRYNSAPVTEGGYVSHLLALKNTINSYRYLNPKMAYSSSQTDTPGIDLSSVPAGLISIPTIFYGSQIKKGTIDLKYYYTGSLIARARDTNRDGLLYEVTGEGAAARTGSCIGLALYNEGFIILTGSYDLGSPSPTDYYYRTAGVNIADNAKWIYFGQPVSRSSGGPILAPLSSFIMEMSGTSTTQTLTMFATAPKGALNQSNNPTFKTYSSGTFAMSSSKAYLENKNIRIKNVVSSSYNDPTGSFEKTTYISKIGVYDQERNLIGIAKVAMPVRKTVERDFTFKIKTDL